MAMTRLDLRVDHQRGIRLAGVNWIHEQSVIREVSLSCISSNPIVGRSPLVPTKISIDGPNGLDVSSSSIGAVFSSKSMTGVSTSSEMM